MKLKIQLIAAYILIIVIPTLLLFAYQIKTQNDEIRRIFYEDLRMSSVIMIPEIQKRADRFLDSSKTTLTTLLNLIEPDLERFTEKIKKNETGQPDQVIRQLKRTLSTRKAYDLLSASPLYTFCYLDTYGGQIYIDYDTFRRGIPVDFIRYSSGEHSKGVVGSYWMIFDDFTETTKSKAYADTAAVVPKGVILTLRTDRSLRIGLPVVNAKTKKRVGLLLAFVDRRALQKELMQYNAYSPFNHTLGFFSTSRSSIKPARDDVVIPLKNFESWSFDNIEKIDDHSSREDFFTTAEARIEAYRDNVFAFAFSYYDPFGLYIGIMKKYEEIPNTNFGGGLIFIGIIFFVIGKLILDNLSAVFGDVYRAADYITVEEANVSTTVSTKRKILRTGIQSVFFSVIELSNKLGKAHVVQRLQESFGRFLHNFDRMLDELAESERMKQELDTAHEMQMGLMPSSFPDVKGFDIYGICLPAREVGGDFYDYFWMDDEKTKIGFAVADVSDKGMRAAMVATFTSGLLLSEAQNGVSTSGILNRLNKPLCLKTERKMFVACQIVVLDTQTGRLQFSNGGQPKPILMHNNKTCYLESEGIRFPLGIVEKGVYQSLSLKMRTADFIVFYTDGITEAMNKKREIYDVKRLQNVVQGLQIENSPVTAKEIGETILDDVKDFVGGAEQNDDLTMIVIKAND